MHPSYHRKITLQALQGEFSSSAIQVIIKANIAQDLPWGQVGHDEYHFDNNAFERGRAYINAQREIILDRLGSTLLRSGELKKAWQAFGRLSHSAQDFYAHSNYIALWVQEHAPDALAAAEQKHQGNEAGVIPVAIDPLDPTLIESSQLRSGRSYLPWGILAYIPRLKPLVHHLLPADSHARMNLDGPDRGPLFHFAYQAAVQRTIYEAQLLRQMLSPRTFDIFCGNIR
ncbi:MAG: hypothetical protein JW726_14300 [Anaerolineales bacterium]|nr:hypothetical protein [Anaerolineales bacterium]